MTELYINGNYIELYNQELLPSSQVGDIFSVEDIYSGITKQFAIPKTPANKKALEGADNIGAITLVPYRKNTAKLIIDGIEVFFNAIALIESSGNSFSCIIKFGNTDFFSLLTEKLNQLDLTDLEHDWSLTEIAASQDNTYSDGYTWALAEFGLQQNQVRYSARHALPSVFVRYLIEKIAADAGYTLAGDIWTDTEFSTDIIPMMSRWTSDGIRDKMKVLAWQNTPQLISYGDAATIVFSDELNDDYNLFDSQSYKAKVNCTLQIAANIYFNTTTLGLTPPIVTIKVFKSSADGLTNTLIDSDTITSYTGNISIITNIELIENESIYIRAEITGMGANVVDIGNPSYSTLYIQVVDAQETCYGLGYPIAENLPDMTQKDLFKAVAMKYGLIYKTDNLTKTLYAERFEDIGKRINTNDSYDWTNKVDLYSEKGDFERINIDYRADIAQKNWFRFTPDETVKSNYGDDNFTVDDTTLDKESDYVKFPFAASPIVTKLNLPMPEIKIYEDYKGSTSSAKSRWLKNYKQSGTLLLKGHSDMTLSLTAGSSGVLAISLSGVTASLVIDFDTDIETTLSNWITEHAQTLDEFGIEVEQTSTQARFYTLAFGKNFNGIVLAGSNITGSVTDNSENSTYTGSLSLALFTDATSILSDYYEARARMLNYFKKLKLNIWLSVYDFVNFDHFKPVFISELGWFYVERINGFRSNSTTECEMIALDSFFNFGQSGFRVDREIDSLEVVFTNESTNALTYRWDFGDGTISTSESPTHTYSSCGVYSVTLTTTDSAGVQNKLTQIVNVPTPSLSFNFKCNSMYL